MTVQYYYHTLIIYHSRSIDVHTYYISPKEKNNIITSLDN